MEPYFFGPKFTEEDGPGVQAGLTRLDPAPDAGHRTVVR